MGDEWLMYSTGSVSSGIGATRPGIPNMATSPAADSASGVTTSGQRQR